MERADRVAELERAHSLSLPQDYRQFLAQHAGKIRYATSEFPLKQWRLWSVFATDWSGRWNGAFDAQTSIGVANFEVVKNAGAQNWPVPAVGIPDASEVSAERLRKSITIGNEDTDYLYLDPTDGFSVWQFQFSDRYVQRVASSFGEWIKRATPYKKGA
jgi:hypothetical protein